MNDLPPITFGKGVHVPSLAAPEMTKEEFARHHQIVKDGKETFVRVGLALSEIRDKFGYKHLGYQTFEAYCEREHGFSRQRGYQLMQAAAIAANPDVNNLLTIQNEAQARTVKQVGVENLKQAAQELHYERHEDAEQIAKSEIPSVSAVQRANQVSLPDAKRLIEKAKEIKKQAAESLKPPRAEKPRVNWSQHARSATNDEAQLIKWLIGLYNNGCAFDLDPTYSEGKLWDGLPRPMHKGDIKPRVEGCEKMDARELPFKDGELGSVFFDPPFIPKDVERDGSLGIIEKRFGGYKSFEELWGMYLDSFKEFYRVLELEGLLVVKNADQIAGGKFYAAFDGVVVQAREVGFTLLYTSVLYREGVQLMSPNMAEQQNPRHNHTYYFVFRKSAKPKDRSKVMNAPGWSEVAQKAVARYAKGKGKK